MGARRILAGVAVIAMFAGGLLIGLATRDGSDGGSGAGAIDWSTPTELPPPTANGYSPQPVEDGFRFFPISGRVTPSEAYTFDTHHCGLGYLIDFDGSLWELLDPGAVPERLSIDQDRGAIALVDFDRAVYRASDGTEVALRRIRGPVVTPPCE
jgi:hypothetical protein